MVGDNVNSFFVDGQLGFLKFKLSYNSEKLFVVNLVIMFGRGEVF
jgi:hypothetical protein